MPCGGINVYSDVPEGTCWVCRKPGAKHYFEEFDTMVHARCAVAKLLNQESELNMCITHEHTIFLDFSLEK